MAYNPYGQLPYSTYAPAMPYLPQAPTQPQTPSTNVSWVYVNGLEGARGQIVQPGQTSWMMDNNQPVIYVKAVDALGTSTLKAFQLTELTGPATSEEKPEYAKASDLAELKARLEKIETNFGGFTA